MEYDGDDDVMLVNMTWLTCTIIEFFIYFECAERAFIFRNNILKVHQTGDRECE